MSNAIVRRRRDSGGGIVLYRHPNRSVAAVANATRLLRNAIRSYRRRRQHAIAASNRSRSARQRVVDRNRNHYRIQGRGNRRFYRVAGTATGPTHTTTRMIVRKTPKEQRFLRKMFKNNPIKRKYVNRFGFAWMGAAAASKTIWYSICHLKFNNIVKYMQQRMTYPSQSIDQSQALPDNEKAVGNGPDAFIYIGKCTFSYELVNPTNYVMTVYIYDLIAKRDTPYPITYNDVNNSFSNAPENCMKKGSQAMTGPMGLLQWHVADPTYEAGRAVFDSIGMKPTDYHLFNTFWKVKGMKKIIMPPTSTHHHVVVFNPKIKITQGSLFYPHERWAGKDKFGLGGLTQATLFGFQGQTATENNTAQDNTNTVGTLPGKLLVTCTKKVNVWNMTLNAQVIESETNLLTEWDEPTIFTDLVEQPAEAT